MKYTAEQHEEIALRLSGGSQSTEDEIIAADMLRQAAALLREQSAPRAAVPDGWMLVPVEPTESMLDAAMQREDDEPLSGWGKLVSAPHKEIYKAMLSAAPSDGGDHV